VPGGSLPRRTTHVHAGHRLEHHRQELLQEDRGREHVGVEVLPEFLDGRFEEQTRTWSLVDADVAQEVDAPEGVERRICGCGHCIVVGEIHRQRQRTGAGGFDRGGDGFETPGEHSLAYAHGAR
jgi:hypothetical protein